MGSALVSEIRLQMESQIGGPATQLEEGKAWRSPRNGARPLEVVLVEKTKAAAEGEVETMPGGKEDVPPGEANVRKAPKGGGGSGVVLRGVIYAVSPVIEIGGSEGGGAKSFFLVKLRLTPSEKGRGTLTSALGPLTSASLSAFLYLEGDSGVRWRPACVADVGGSVSIKGVKKRVMVGQGSSERVLFTAGKHFRVDFEGAEDRKPCGGVREGNPSGEVASCSVPKEVSEKGAENGDKRTKAGATVSSGGHRQGRKHPPHEHANGTLGLRKGLPHVGTLCYVGVVTGFWPPGFVIELDGRVNLLLTHYPVTQIGGLKTGSLLAAWHVIPILRRNRVVALGACTRSLVSNLGSVNPRVSDNGVSDSGVSDGKSKTGFRTGLGSQGGLDVRLASRSHPLRQLCDRLPFPTAFWVVELDRSLRLKLTGMVNCDEDDGMAEGGAGREASDGANELRVQNGLPGSNGLDETLFEGPANEPRLSRSLDSSVPPANETRILTVDDLARQITQHYLPGFKTQRLRRDVFEEFMSSDAQNSLGGEFQGWKEPPEVLPIGSLVKQIRQRIRTATGASEGVSGDELGSALLGQLQVDPCSGRAVLADTTGSVQIRVQEQLEAVHLGRWMLVTNFSADVRSSSDPGLAAVSVRFSLADAVLMSAPALSFSPGEPWFLSSNRGDARTSCTVKKSTWMRPDVRKRKPDPECTELEEGATWQNGGERFSCQIPTGIFAEGVSKERVEQTPFWVVSVFSKTEITNGASGFQFAAEAVVVPRVLSLASAAARGSNVSKRLDEFRVSQTGPRNPNTQAAKILVTSPRSGLVRSYHQAVANEVRQNSGPPWLVDNAKRFEDAQNAPAADTCLYMPAWERNNRISNRVSDRVSDGLGPFLAKTTGRPSNAPGSRDPRGSEPSAVTGLRRMCGANPIFEEANPCSGDRAKTAIAEQGGLEGPAFVGKARLNTPQVSGPCPKRPCHGWGAKNDTRNGYRAPGFTRWAVVGSAELARVSGTAPGGKLRAVFEHLNSHKQSPDVQIAPGINPRAVCGAAAAVGLAPESSPRAVLGAAGTVRNLDGFARQVKRPRWCETLVKRTESVNCSVYWQALGGAGCADQELERGPPMSAALERLEPLNTGPNFGARFGVGDKVSGTWNGAAGERPRVMLVLRGDAALLYDVIHVGRLYIIPAPQAMSTVDTDSEPASSPLAPPKYAYPRLPVIDLTERESVHSCQFVSGDPAADSKETGTGVASAETGRRVPASLVLEVPEREYREVLPFLNAELSTQRAGEPAIGPSGSHREIGGVLLRGRVVAVLELQLEWGCPYCGAVATAGAVVRTLRTGCARCCADASECTVLVRQACLSFDDGASQCEVWAEGSAAAGLLALPYAASENPLKETPSKGTLSKKTHMGYPTGVRSSEVLKPSIPRTAVFLEPCSAQIQPTQDNSSREVHSRMDSEPTAGVVIPNIAPGLGNPVVIKHARNDGLSPRQQNAGLPFQDTLHSNPLQDPLPDPLSDTSVKRLQVGDSHSAREALVESVKKRQRAGNSKAAQYEPDALFRNLHRCLLDVSKLAKLVRKEGLVRVKANASGAADGSFLAAQLEMSGADGRPLSGTDREGLEVLVGRACRQGQQVLTCVPLPPAPADRSRFLTKEQGAASGGGRCRVYLSGQVYEIHAPTVTRYRALKSEPVTPSVEAALLCSLLSETNT